MSQRKTSTGTIREQLLQQGFKESPVLYVERLYVQHQELMTKPVWSTGFRKRLESRVQALQDKITKICDTRGIGNPLKGEPIEWKKPEKAPSPAK